MGCVAFTALLDAGPMTITAPCSIRKYAAKDKIRSITTRATATVSSNVL